MTHKFSYSFTKWIAVRDADTLFTDTLTDTYVYNSDGALLYQYAFLNKKKFQEERLGFFGQSYIQLGKPFYPIIP